MSREKSKELYAKTIMSALGDLDDDLIVEAHEEETKSIPSALYRVWQYVPRAAASFLFIGVLVLIVLLAGRVGTVLRPLGSDGESDPQASFAISRSADVSVQWEPSKDAPDCGTLTFIDLGDAEILYFIFTPGAEGLPSVLYNGETPKLVEINGDVYYQIPVKGLDRVSVSLSGVSDPSDIQIRIMVGKEETVIRPSA